MVWHGKAQHSTKCRSLAEHVTACCHSTLPQHAATAQYSIGQHSTACYSPRLHAITCYAVAAAFKQQSVSVLIVCFLVGSPRFVL